MHNNFDFYSDKFKQLRGNIDMAPHYKNGLLFDILFDIIKEQNDIINTLYIVGREFVCKETHKNDFYRQYGGEIEYGSKVIVSKVEYNIKMRDHMVEYHYKEPSGGPNDRFGSHSHTLPFAEPMTNFKSYFNASYS